MVDNVSTARCCRQRPSYVMRLPSSPMFDARVKTVHTPSDVLLEDDGSGRQAYGEQRDRLLWYRRGGRAPGAASPESREVTVR